MTKVMKQNQVSQLLNPFSIPEIVCIKARPNPLTDITLREPIMEQTPIQMSNVYVEVSVRVDRLMKTKTILEKCQKILNWKTSEKLINIFCYGTLPGNLGR